MSKEIVKKTVCNKLNSKLCNLENKCDYFDSHKPTQHRYKEFRKKTEDVDIKNT